MHFTFFGTGTSQGVPLIGCNCEVCQSTDPRDKRLRTSGLLRYGDTKVLIDAGPDFRYQMLRSGTSVVDAILLTHMHYDHVGGMDDVRNINYITRRPMNVYCDEHCEAALRRNLYYVFEPNPYPGVPKIELINHRMQSFRVGNLDVQPLSVLHGNMTITAYRFGPFAYITDASSIPEATYESLIGVDTIVINALRPAEHMSHFSLSQALDAVRRIKPRRAYLVHCNHELGLHAKVNISLPLDVHLAYDGLEIHI